MRKVFLSIMLLGKLEPGAYVSEDFAVEGKNYYFPLSYLIDNTVEDNDEVEIITAVERSAEGVQKAADNYEIFVQEIKSILAARKVQLHFTEITTSKDFESTTFNRFFKQVAEYIQDNDKLYADITFGMKPYSIAMFIAMAYVAKAARNVEMETIMYSQKYTGTTNEAAVSKLFDLTALFYLNAMAGNAKAGQRAGLDELLNFVISE